MGLRRKSIRLAPIIIDVTSATLHLTGEATRTYILQRSFDLIAWTDVTSAPAPASTFTMTDPAAHGRALYRVRAK